MLAVEPVSLIDRNMGQWHGLLDTCEDLLRKGQYDAAATYSQMAGTFAYKNHPGVFSSRRLEETLLELSRSALESSTSRSVARPESAPPKRIVHVMTKGFAIGGHTRLVERWARLDADRSHSLVVTGQGRDDFPTHLRAVITSSKGAIHLLDRGSNHLLKRAKALRDVVKSCDLVVLHTDPGDVVPLLAFGNSHADPRVILLNHADHTFWLGLLASHVVANLRESGLRLTVDRRGVDADRCTVLPIPLDDVTRTVSRTAAKRAVGITPDTFLVVSVAAQHKYEMRDGIGFMDAMAPFVRNNKSVVLLVIGPRPEGQWLKASAETNHRMRALGVRTDPQLFYQAADVYADSFPCSSLTSALEAITYGLPVVSLRIPSDEPAVLSADSPGLACSFNPAVTVADYLKQISHLIEAGEAERVLIGAQLREEVRRLHVGRGWTSQCEALYQHALSLGTRITFKEIEDRRDHIDILVERLQDSAERSGSMGRGLTGTIREHIGLLPLKERTSVWWKLCRSSDTLPLWKLTPQWVLLLLWRALVFVGRRSGSKY